MSQEKNSEPERWFRKECKKAKICDKCEPICRGKFKKVIELTQSGLMLYAHNNRNEAKTGNASDRSFVLYNSSGRSIKKLESSVKELSEYNSQCCTCSDMLDKIQKLLTGIKTIGKNEVLGICEHCNLKGLPIQCEKCSHITKKFLLKRVEHIEYRHDKLKQWLEDLKQMLLAIIQQEAISKHLEEASKYELKILLRELQKQTIDHKLNIRTFPESEIEDAEVAEAVEREKKILTKVITILEREKLSMKGNLDKALGPQFIKNMPNKILGNLGSLTKTKLNNLLGPILTDKIIEKIIHNFGRPSKEMMDQVLGTDLSRQMIDKLLDNVGTLTTEKAENMFEFQTTNRLIDSILNKYNYSPTKDNFEKIFGKYVVKEKVAEMFSNFKEKLSRKQLEEKVGIDEAKKIMNEALNNFGRLKLEKLEKIAPGDVTKDILNKLLFNIGKLTDEKLTNLFDPDIAKKYINKILSNFGDSLFRKRVEEQLGSSLAKEVMEKLLDILRREKLTRAKLENLVGPGLTKEVLDKILANLAGESSTKQKLEKLLGHETPARLMGKIAPIFKGVNLTVEILENFLGSEVANEVIDNMLANLRGEAAPKIEGALKKTKQSSTDFIEERISQETKKISDGRKNSHVSGETKNGLNKKSSGQVSRESKLGSEEKKEERPKKSQAALDKKVEKRTKEKRNEILPIESEANLAKIKTEKSEALQVKDKKQESETVLSKLLKKKQQQMEKEQKRREKNKPINITNEAQQEDFEDLLKNIIGPKKNENEDDSKEKVLSNDKIIQKERKPRRVKKISLQAGELQGLLNKIKLKTAPEEGGLTPKPEEKMYHEVELLQKKDSKIIDLKDVMDSILPPKENKYNREVTVRRPLFQIAVKEIDELTVSADEDLQEELIKTLELYEAQEKRKRGKSKARGKIGVISKAVSDTAIGKDKRYTEKKALETLLGFLKKQVKDERLTRKLQEKLERDLLKHQRNAEKKLKTELPLFQQLKHIYANEIKESVIGCTTPNEREEMIKGTRVVPRRLLLPKKDRKNPLLFNTKPTCPSISSSSLTLHEVKLETSVVTEWGGKGILTYQLSNPKFIRRGWTKLPTLRTVRQMNIYKMCPTKPAYDWFNRHKDEGTLFYETGEKLAEIDQDGHGRWYYKNGVLALDFYKAQEKNIHSRYVVYSSGERDENGNPRAITVLASFDLLGNGIIYDHMGHERLKYNQTEGILFDKKIGPLSKWKWHQLNDSSPISCKMFEDKIIDAQTQNNGSLKMEKENGESLNDQMLIIERDNFVKKNQNMKKFRTFQIKPKNFKINDNFSLHIIDQRDISLRFRDGHIALKQNLGLSLDDKEVIDTVTVDLSEVLTPFDRPKSESVENLISILKNTRAKSQAKVWSPEKCKKYYKIEKTSTHGIIR